MLGPKKGKIILDASGDSIPVWYAFADLALDDLRGKIWIDNNTEPAAPFVASSSSVAAPLRYTLETIGNVRLSVIFTDVNGDFKCCQPAIARAALARSGELGRMPGEVVSLLLHASYPVPSPANRRLH